MMLTRALSILFRFLHHGGVATVELHDYLAWHDLLGSRYVMFREKRHRNGSVASGYLNPAALSARSAGMENVVFIVLSPVS